MVIYVKGDLFASEADIIAHGCNCQGGFGSGVAGIMAKKFPKARRYYLDKFEAEGWLPGDVQFVKIYGDRYIANCATQDHYLPRGICHADYVAIRTCMNQVKEFATVNRLSIAMPKIGAGLAGGDWQKIASILDEVFSDYNVAVYYL